MQGESKARDAVAKNVEGTEIYNGANYSIKLLDPSISITDGSFQIVTPILNVGSNSGNGALNEDVARNAGNDHLSKFLALL